MIPPNYCSGSPPNVVEIAGERLHIMEAGPGDGPPVLLSMGLGGAWFEWDPVVELLRDRHRVIVFDRPGLGLSPPARRPPTLRREVRLLAGLARWAGAPAVVVAHSVAGFHAEALARVHPELVRGLVLVDGSYERTTWTDVRLSAAVQPVLQLAGTAAGLTGVPRLIAPRVRRWAMRYFSYRNPPVPAVLVRAVYGRGTVIGTVLAENAAYREMAADLNALRARLPFPPVPLVVLTALGDKRNAEKAQAWLRDQRVLTGLSPYGRQVELWDSLHMVPLDRPDAVADAVAGVLATVP